MNNDIDGWKMIDEFIRIKDKSYSQKYKDYLNNGTKNLASDKNQDQIYYLLK